MTKVLVVDDSISVRKALERILVPKGMEVIVAENAMMAMQTMGREKPHLVIADVVMPDKSGFELCQMLKRDDHNLPVILISGIVDATVLQRAKDVGANAVIRKPFMADDLFSKIEQAMGTPLDMLVAPKPQSTKTPTGLDLTQPQTLESLLDPLMEKPEVLTAALYDVQGNPLLMRGKNLPDPNLMGTFCRTLFSVGGALGVHLEHPGLHALSLEYQGQNVFIMAISESNVLVVVSNATSTPATVRYVAGRQAPLLRETLKRLN